VDIFTAFGGTKSASTHPVFQICRGRDDVSILLTSVWLVRRVFGVAVGFCLQR
jgi:hypothetical protein